MAAAPAVACPEIPVPLDGPNFFELFLGATNSNAALGQGGLTAAYSACGELTTLKWPGPGSNDQLSYLTGNDRGQPRLGALEDMGAFAGISYVARGQRRLTWLRDDPWSHRQAWADEESEVLVTESVNATLGLRVTARSFVLADRDVLATRYLVERERGSPARRARLVFYTNFSPTLTRIPFFPFGDSLLDFENDFAVVYDRRARALLHFLPAGARDGAPDFAPFDHLLRDPPRSRRALQRRVQRLIPELVEPGVYIGIAAAPRDDGFQAGFDDAPLCAHQSPIAERAIDLFGLAGASDAALRDRFVCERAIRHPGGPLGTCRDERGWRHRAESAFTDARDGRLSRSPLAACQANAALVRRLRFRRRRAEATFYVAIGATADAARTLLREARDADPGAQEAAVRAWWADFLRPARLPNTDDPLVGAFARRSLAVMRTATDNRSGAIVASVTAQPPYGFDWPRDGAFINYALDLAGYRDIVSRHNRFYARVQRRVPGSWSPIYPFPACDPEAPAYPDCIPAGTWEGNYHADPDAAVPGYPFSFEIDAAGLATWTMGEHADRIEDPDEAASYLADVCPAIALAAASLAACRDPLSGLQCAALEDDNLALTRGLQGAVTVLLALRTAVDVAPRCGFPAASVAAWSTRADELTQAILEDFTVATPHAHLDGPRSAWVIWPVGLLPPTDPLIRSHADFLAETRLDALLARSVVWSAYEAEVLLARAQLARQLGNAADLGVAQEQVRVLVRELTTAGTLLLSESYGRVGFDRNGDGVVPDYLPLNSVPHTWAHAYLYAAAMIAFGSR